MRGVLMSGAVLAALAAGPALAQTPLQPGSTFSGKLDEPDAMRANGEHFKCFQIAGRPGDRLELNMRSTAFDAALLIVAHCDVEDETAGDDDSGGDRNARLIVELGDAPYYVQATSAGLTHGHGPFSLSVERTYDFPNEVCVNEEPARRADAIKTCKRLADDDRISNSVRATALGQLAYYALNESDYGEAVVRENRALDLAGLPNSYRANAHFRRAQGKSGLGDHAGALEDLAAAEALIGANLSIQRVRADVRSAMGDSAGAMREANEAVRLYPNEGQAWATRAAVKQLAADWAGAAADYDEALERDPDQVEWLYQRGRARTGMSDYAAAISDMDAVIRREPSRADAWFVRGQAHEADGRLETALSDYDQALTLNPRGDVALLRRSQLHLDLGNHDQAIADADRAAEVDPDNADYHNQRCWARAVANRDLDVAKAACDRSLALSPGQAHVLDSRGLVYFRQGRFMEAWGDYHAAVQNEPDYAGYLYGRGLSALRLGRDIEGRADIDAALALDPDVGEDYASRGLRP